MNIAFVRPFILLWCNDLPRKLNNASPEVLMKVWPKIVWLFKCAPAVYSGRIGAAGKIMFEVEVLNLLVEINESEKFFQSMLEDRNPKLVAYCLLGLSMHSEFSPMYLNDNIFKREEEVLFYSGSFYQKIPLGSFANSLSSIRQRTGVSTGVSARTL